MQVDLTRHSLGWTLLLFAGLTLLFWIRSLAAPLPEVATFSTQMPLGIWIDRFGHACPLWIKNLLIVLIVFWNGLLLTRLMSRNMLVLERTYMPFILYLLVACGLSFGRAPLAPYVAAGLLVSAFDLMIGSFRRVVVYAKSFDSALLTGLSILVYGPAALYALLLPCALLLFRKDWREWLTCLTGLFLPFLIASYVYWGLGESFGHLGERWWQEICERLAAPFYWQQSSELLSSSISALGERETLTLLITAWTPLVLVTGIALAVFILRTQNMRTRPYKTYLYFIWILVFSLILLLTPGGSMSDLPLVAAPLAIVIPNFFTRFGGWIGNLTYLLLLGCIILYNLLILAFT